jgi:hypothetical protein
MKVWKAALVATSLMFAVTGSAAIAQERSYTPGTVWVFSNIDVIDGQFENYMDYLAGNWKRVNEIGKREGAVVSYHVFSVNNARMDEPDLILGIEYKDYVTTAEQEAIQKRVNAALAQTERTAAKAYADRGTMRKSMGTMEVQELKLK